MPNWCNNVVTLSHEDPNMLERVKTGFRAEKLFSEFVPSPTGEYDYDWSVSNWGSKWDVGENEEFPLEEEDDTITLCFDSAWSPPIEFYNQMVELGFTVEAYYHEPGMQFAGSYTNDEGEDTASYGEWTADQIREYIPELDERFCISEMTVIEQNEDV